MLYFAFRMDDFNFQFGMDQPGPPPPNAVVQAPGGHGMDNPGPQMQSQRQVQMWQEQSYMVPESGFVSRSNTGPNSAITGQDLDDGGGGGCYTGPGSIVSDRTMGSMSFFDLDSGAPSGKLKVNLEYFL